MLQMLPRDDFEFNVLSWKNRRSDEEKLEMIATHRKAQAVIDRIDNFLAKQARTKRI